MPNNTSFSSVECQARHLCRGGRSSAPKPPLAAAKYCPIEQLALSSQCHFQGSGTRDGAHMTIDDEKRSPVKERYKLTLAKRQ